MTTPDKKPGVKRTGNCWEASFNKLIEMGSDPEVRLAHGLPTGTGGNAAKVGVYPHAWIEKGDKCWDCAIDDWVHKAIYYCIGRIEYVVRYNHQEALRAIDSHGTFGPWETTIIARDAEIDRVFG